MPNVESMCQTARVTPNVVTPRLILFTASSGTYGTFSYTDDPITAAPLNIPYIGVSVEVESGAFPVMWPWTDPATGGGNAYAVSGLIYIVKPSGVTELVATEGTAPSGSLDTVCVWQDRLVVSDGRRWYMSKSGDHEDWDYAALGDAGAVAGTGFAGGTLGDAILALVPASNDALYFFCSRSIYRMVGNPRTGGRIEVISRNVGIAGEAAWSYDPTGAVWFADQNGLWHMTADGKITPITRDKVRSPFNLISPDTHRVSVVWHEPWQSCMVFLTTLATAASTHVHFYLPDEFVGVNVFATNNIGPMSAISFRSDSDPDANMIVLGGRDSRCRSWDLLATQDDGTDFFSYVFVGPFEFAGPGKQAKVVSLDAVMGEIPAGVQSGSGWSGRVVLYAASDAFSALLQPLSEQVKVFTPYTVFGVQDRRPARVSMQTAFIRIDNAATNGSLQVKKFWSIDRLYVNVLTAGSQDGNNI